MLRVRYSAPDLLLSPLPFRFPSLKLPPKPRVLQGRRDLARALAWALAAIIRAAFTLLDLPVAAVWPAITAANAVASRDNAPLVGGDRSLTERLTPRAVSSRRKCPTSYVR
jgi:hypothetical protein